MLRFSFVVLLLTILATNTTGQNDEIKRSKSLNLVYTGPTLTLHLPGTTNEQVIFLEIPENYSVDIAKDEEAISKICALLLPEIPLYDATHLTVDEASKSICADQITRTKALLQTALSKLKIIDKYVDKGVTVGIPSLAENTATITLQADVYVKQVLFDLQAAHARYWEPDTEGRDKKKDFSALCAGLGAAWQTAVVLDEHVTEFLGYLNTLSNNRISDNLLASLDLINNKTAGRFEHTEIILCRKMARGLKCKVGSTSQQDSTEIAKLHSVPFKVGDFVVQVDWAPKEIPVIKPATSVVGDANGCQVTSVAVTCHQELEFSVNHCLESILEQQVDKILEQCNFKKINSENMKPFVYSREGQTLISQRGPGAMSLKISTVSVFSDPVLIKHKDPIYMTYISNQTTLLGSDSVTTQEICSFIYNDTVKDKMAIKSNKFVHLVHQILPGSAKDYLILVTLIVQIIALIVAIIWLYRCIRASCCDPSETTTEEEESLARNPLIGYFLDSFENSRVKSKISSGKQLSAQEYRVALKVYCQNGPDCTEQVHCCPFLPPAAWSEEVRNLTIPAEAKSLETTSASAPLELTSETAPPALPESNAIMPRPAHGYMSTAAATATALNNIRPHNYNSAQSFGTYLNTTGSVRRGQNNLNLHGNAVRNSNSLRPQLRMSVNPFYNCPKEDFRMGLGRL